MYRPNNWDEIKPEFGSGTTAPFCDGFDEGVEAGADAILEELVKRGIPNDVYQCYLKGAMLQGLDIKQPYTYCGKKGTLVFIPEE